MYIYTTVTRQRRDNLSENAASSSGRRVDIKVASRARSKVIRSRKLVREYRVHRLHSVISVFRCVSLRHSQVESEATRKRIRHVVQCSKGSHSKGATAVWKVRPSGINEATKIPTFSEVCKRGALRIKPPKEQSEILTVMTCCQEPQSYHAQATMTDR